MKKAPKIQLRRFKTILGNLAKQVKTKQSIREIITLLSYTLEPELEDKFSPEEIKTRDVFLNKYRTYSALLPILSRIDAKYIPEFMAALERMHLDDDVLIQVRTKLDYRQEASTARGISNTLSVIYNEPHQMLEVGMNTLVPAQQYVLAEQLINVLAPYTIIALEETYGRDNVAFNSYTNPDGNVAAYAGSLRPVSDTIDLSNFRDLFEIARDANYLPDGSLVAFSTGFSIQRSHHPNPTYYSFASKPYRIIDQTINISEMIGNLQSTILNNFPYEDEEMEITTDYLQLYSLLPPPGGCYYLSHIPENLLNVSPRETDNNCLFHCLFYLNKIFAPHDKRLSAQQGTELILSLRNQFQLLGKKMIPLILAQRIILAAQSLYSLPTLPRLFCAETTHAKDFDICLWNAHYFIIQYKDISIFRETKKNDLNIILVHFDIESKRATNGTQIPVVYGFTIDLTFYKQYLKSLMPQLEDQKITEKRKKRIREMIDAFHMREKQCHLQFHYRESFLEMMKVLFAHIQLLRYRGTMCLNGYNSSNYDNILAMKELCHCLELNGKKHYATLTDICVHNNALIKAKVRFKTLYPKVVFTLFDLAKFIPKSLKKALKMFRCTYSKESFEYEKIDYLNHMQVKDRDDLIKYLHTDVMGLADLFKRKNEIFFDMVGEHIYKFISTSNATYAKFCQEPIAQNIMLPYNVSDDTFMRRCIYGGNCSVYKRYYRSNLLNLGDALTLQHYDECTDYLIALDANSLYPTGCTFNMPYGAYHRIVCGDLDTITYDLLFKEINHGERMGCLRCRVLEVSNEIAYCWFPYRKKDGIKFDFDCLNKIIYITTIQFQDMVRVGYKLLIVEAILFESNGPVLKEYICTLYQKRVEAKANMKKEPERAAYWDSLQEEIKLFMNGLYGKLIQKPIFMKTSFELLTQNVIERLNALYDKGELGTLNLMKDYAMYTTEKRSITACTKPCYLGAFVLSYSKRLMMKAFEEMNILYDYTAPVYYTDTDSIYCHMDLAKRIPHLLGPNLGQMKSDYGDNVKIVEAYFLAKKIKVCRCWIKTKNYIVDCPDIIDGEAADHEEHILKGIYCNKTCKVIVPAVTGESLIVEVLKFTMKGVSKKKGNEQLITWDDYAKLYNGEKLKYTGLTQFRKTLFNENIPRSLNEEERAFLERAVMNVTVHTDLEKNISIAHTFKQAIYNEDYDAFLPLGHAVLHR